MGRCQRTDDELRFRGLQRPWMVIGLQRRVDNSAIAASNQAFTLVELLVVIAVIAVLAGILFPVFVTAKQQAATSTCVGNLKQLSTAVRMYADNNSGALPCPRRIRSDWPDNWAGVDKPSAKVYPEHGQIWEYVRSANIYVCPADRGRPANRVLTRAQRKDDHEMEEYARIEYPLSYSMNDTLYDLERLTSLRTDTVRRHSTILLLIHESRDTIDDGAYSWRWDAVASSVANPTDVHAGGGNLAHLDGHVKWFTLAEIERQRHSGIWSPGYRQQ